MNTNLVPDEQYEWNSHMFTKLNPMLLSDNSEELEKGENDSIMVSMSGQETNVNKEKSQGNNSFKNASNPISI